MLSELKTTTSHVGELEGMLKTDDKIKRGAGLLKAISVPTRITALRDFATACRTLVGLERQAFSIVEDKEPPPPPPNRYLSPGRGLGPAFRVAQGLPAIELEMYF
jgi:hypothetical protein